MNITSNAYYEIPLPQEAAYDAAAEAAASQAKGECFCHVTMHQPHGGFPCDVCKAEVEREFIAWCQEDEPEDREPSFRDLLIFEISQLDIVEFDELMREVFKRDENERKQA